MELKETEEKIKEYIHNKWKIEGLDEDISEVWLEYEFISPFGIRYFSDHLGRNVCQICYDLTKEENDECNGSLHDPKLVEEQKTAKKLADLVYERDKLKGEYDLRE